MRLRAGCSERSAAARCLLCRLHLSTRFAALTTVPSGIRPAASDHRPWAVDAPPGPGGGMQLRSFLKAGHTPSLICAFLYFDISFMVWVLLGALANAIVPDLKLNEAQRGLMV